MSNDTEGLEDIYVGKYMLQLPSEETIRQYLIDNMPPLEQFEGGEEDKPTDLTAPTDNKLSARI